MSKLQPEILIFVDGGVVQAVYTTKSQLSYRLVDLDNLRAGGKPYVDYEADQTLIDIDGLTKELVGEELTDELEDRTPHSL